MSEDIETYLGLEEGRELQIGGERLCIRPLTLRQLGPVARAARPLVGVDLEAPLALAAHTEEVVEALALATGQEADWLYGLAPDDLVRLAGAVLEVNGDFFARRLAPAIEEAAAGLGVALGGAAHSSG